MALLQDEELYNINNTSLMANGSLWWDFSPNGFDINDANNLVVSSDGTSYGSNVNKAYGVRPVVTLKPDILFEGGDGSEADPWIVEDYYEVIYNSRYVSVNGTNRQSVKYSDGTTDIRRGSLIAPTNACNTFEGWFEDEELTTPFVLENHIDEDMEVYAKYTGNEFCFPYTGSEDSFFAYTDSTYLLESWGGQGGNTTSSSSCSLPGAYGGYSKGIAHFANGEKLYLNVGGQGASGTKSSTAKTINGGYNGGAKGYQRGSNNTAVGGGGGATHIALSSGLLSTFSDTTKRLDLILVAGGGGGGHSDTDANGYNTKGGSGGGSTGGTVVYGKYGTNCNKTCIKYTFPTGGTQTAGGKGLPDWEKNSGSTTSYAGKFGSGSTGKSSYGGGGGGYYGGGSGQYVGGGGGSGYLNTTLLTDYGMWGYTGVSGANTTIVTTIDKHVPEVANIGAGYAKITVNSPVYGITYNSTYIAFEDDSFTNSVYYELDTTNITAGGGTVKIPTNACNTFEVWYEDKALTIPFNINNHVNQNIEVYAKYTGNEFCFPYSGKKYKFDAFREAEYTIETWGAQGGGTAGAKGAYTSGVLELDEDDKLYLYVGAAGTTTKNIKSFNSGTSNSSGYNGGGATDVRIVAGEWDNIESLRSRLMVAAGGGAGNASTGPGGTLKGIDGGGTKGGTQTTFGAVQSSSYTVSSFGIANGGCSGGNGYYPGGGATCASGAGGGSSFVSGYTGSIAVLSSESTSPRTGTGGAPCLDGTTDDLCSVHYSGKVFSSPDMIAGDSSMPSPGGETEVGHSGDGYARITVRLNEYKVTYNSSYIAFDNNSFKNIVYYKNGTTTIANNGGTVKIPTNACNTFEGWYEDTDFTIPFNINNHVNQNMEVYAKYTSNEFCFENTNSEKKFNAFSSDNYKLEVWGGQGGQAIKDTALDPDANEGYGGYSVGTASLSNSETLYINVGGKGENGTLSGCAAGGYNGGGRGTNDSTTTCGKASGESGGNDASGGGGGATHIATASGPLKDLSDNRNSVLIVAGGGGGNAPYGTGGSGGGANGGIVTGTHGTGDLAGGQETGYAFGYGQDASGRANASGSYGVGGGGGGWYGGYMNDVGQHSSGTGGSGYLNKSVLTNYGMWCSTGCSGDDTTAVDTSGEHQSQTPNVGAGYAKITIVNN